MALEPSAVMLQQLQAQLGKEADGPELQGRLQLVQGDAETCAPEALLSGAGAQAGFDVILCVNGLQ